DVPPYVDQCADATVPDLPTTDCDAPRIADPVVALDVGPLWACAVRQSGRLWCWGYGSMHAVTLVSSNTPVELGIGQQWLDVTLSRVNGDFVCLLRADHSAHCFGSNLFTGALGVGDTDDRADPTPIVGSNHYLEIEAGQNFTCAIRDDGALFCWGTNTYGQV